METIYNALEARLKELTQLKTVDVYNGQFEAKDDVGGNAGFDFPAVFLSFEDIQFPYASSEEFTGVLRVRIGTNQLVKNRADVLRLSKLVDDKLNGFRGRDMLEPLAHIGLTTDEDSTNVYTMQRTYFIRGLERIEEQTGETVTVTPDIVVTR